MNKMMQEDTKMRILIAEDESELAKGTCYLFITGVIKHLKYHRAYSRMFL